MRKGHDNSWMVDETNGNVIAINLGADYCAEHEWGIKNLKEILGCNEGNDIGIEARRCKNVNKDAVFLVEIGDSLNLVIESLWMMGYWKADEKNGKLKTRVPSEVASFYKDEHLLTAWDEGSLIIRVNDEKGKKNLKLLHEQLLAGNVAMWLGGGHVFKNAGLILAIIQNVPEENRKQMLDADTDSRKLVEAADATGIRQEIDELNKKFHEEHKENFRGSPHGYMALSPAWIRSDKNSKYKVMFWLNPYHQDKNNWGWYTVEELKQWLKNEGPIPKKAKV